MTAISSRVGARRDAALLERYHRHHDHETRDALVRRYLPLAQHLARRYHAQGEDEDLQQIAAVGLLKALERFDPALGIAFSSYAVPTILGELRRYFRDHGWSVRPPRDVQELSLRLDRVTDALTGELGRAPTTAELAGRCDCTVEQVVEALSTASAHHAISVDLPRSEDSDEPSSILGGRVDPGFGDAEDAADFERLLSVLPERERTVLKLRFQDELTQREIGDIVGLSQMQISRLISKAIATLQSTQFASTPVAARGRGSRAHTRLTRSPQAVGISR